MATIVKFEIRHPGQARSRRHVPEGGGEVVIFPGVRIEREEFKLSDRLTGNSPDDSGQRRNRRQTTGK